MRLNTTKRYYHLVYIYIIMILVLIFDFVTHSLGSDGSAGEAPVLWYYVAALFLFFWYRGNPVFIYDSDGEVIIITSKEPSLAKLIKPCNVHYEFPKRKVIGYSINRMPLKKTVTIRLESKEGTTKKVKASISYINKQEVKDLERSLRSVLSKNKKSKVSNAG